MACRPYADPASSSSLVLTERNERRAMTAVESGPRLPGLAGLASALGDELAVDDERRRAGEERGLVKDDVVIEAGGVRAAQVAVLTEGEKDRARAMFVDDRPSRCCPGTVSYTHL